MDSENFPTREDATNLSLVGMFIWGYLQRPPTCRSEHVTEEHERSIVKIFKFIINLIEEKERQ